MAAVEVEVLHALRARGRDVATVWVRAGRLMPGLVLAATDGARWRVAQIAFMRPEADPHGRRVVALIRQRAGRLPVVGEHLVASEG
jgi:hypothetical protein